MIIINIYNNVLHVCALPVTLPCAEVDFAISMYFYSHIFSRYPVIFCCFDIPEKRIWCPDHLSCVSCHIERRAHIMCHSWVSPPLTEEYIHCVFLYR